jgi:hypothetical protein
MRDLLLPHSARLLAVQLMAHVARHAAALPLILGIARRTLNNSLRGGWRTLNNFNRGQPNIGMHPTGESGNVIRKLGCLCQSFPAGDAGRYVSASG